MLNFSGLGFLFHIPAARSSTLWVIFNLKYRVYKLLGHFVAYLIIVLCISPSISTTLYFSVLNICSFADLLYNVLRILFSGHPAVARSLTSASFFLTNYNSKIMCRCNKSSIQVPRSNRPHLNPVYVLCLCVFGRV